MHANRIIQMAIMSFKNGENKSKKSKTCVKHFVYLTSSLFASEVEFNRQITDMRPHPYARKQCQMLHSAEKNLELDKIQLFLLKFELELYIHGNLSVSK